MWLPKPCPTTVEGSASRTGQAAVAFQLQAAHRVEGEEDKGPLAAAQDIHEDRHEREEEPGDERLRARGPK